MNNFAAGQYYPGDSFLHRLDPRTKLIALFLYYLFLFLSEGVYAYLTAAVLGFVIVISSQVAFKLYFRAVRMLLLFIALAAVFACFFTAGTVIWQAGAVKITAQGVAVATVMAVRFTLILFSALALTFSTTPLAVTAGLAKLFAPLKKIGVPVAELTMTMSLALRFIPVMIREAETTKLAQQSRGLELSAGPLWRRTMNLLPLVLPLFVAAFRRAEELANAMEARGYRNDVERSAFHALAYRASDRGVIFLFLLLVVLISIYRWLL